MSGISDTRQPAALPMMANGLRWLAWLAAAGLLVWLLLSQPQRQWQGGIAHLDVQIDGTHYRVHRDELLWLEQFSALHFNGHAEAAREQVAGRINSRLDQLFDQVHARLPDYADWYFSIRGEYSRMGALALSRTALLDEQAVINHTRKRLFPDQGFVDELEWLRRQTDGSLLRRAEQAREGWLATVMARLESHATAVPAPLQPSTRTLSIDALGEQLLGYQQPEFIQRISASGVTAAGVALGPALWRATTARSSSRAVAMRGAGRGATRAGAAAGTGGLVCSPGGPLAFGCAVVAGAATWLATDWLLLRADELRNRDDLIAALEQDIQRVRAQLEADMLVAYDRAIQAQYDGMQGEVIGSFVPLRAGQSRADT